MTDTHTPTRTHTHIHCVLVLVLDTALTTCNIPRNKNKNKNKTFAASTLIGSAQKKQQQEVKLKLYRWSRIQQESSVLARLDDRNHHWLLSVPHAVVIAIIVIYNNIKQRCPEQPIANIAPHHHPLSLRTQTVRFPAVAPAVPARFPV